MNPELLQVGKRYKVCYKWYKSYVVINRWLTGRFLGYSATSLFFDYHPNRKSGMATVPIADVTEIQELAPYESPYGNE